MFDDTLDHDKDQLREVMDLHRWRCSSCHAGHHAGCQAVRTLSDGITQGCECWCRRDPDELMADARDQLDEMREARGDDDE